MMINYNKPRAIRALSSMALALGLIAYSGAGVAAAPEKIADADCYGMRISDGEEPLSVNVELHIDSAWASGQRHLKDINYDFGDKTPSAIRTEQGIVTHTYAAIGTYTVQANVSEFDAYGNTMLGGTTCPPLIINVPLYAGAR